MKINRNIFPFLTLLFIAFATHLESNRDDELYKAYRNRMINRVVDLLKLSNSSVSLEELNAYPEADTLTPGEVEDLNEFKNSANYSEYRTKANDLIAKGGLVKEFYFNMKCEPDQKTKYSYTPKQEISSSALLPISLGRREMIQYRLQLERLASELHDIPGQYAKQAKMVLHINHANQEDIENDLLEFEWFGFSPENIVLIVQPIGPSYYIEKGKFLPSNAATGLSGHGYPLTQTVRCKVGEAYTLSADGTRLPLSQSVVSYLRDKNAQWMLSSAANDLTQMVGSSTLDPDRLALVLYLADKKFNIVMEMVENPSKRIGAYWVQNSKKQSFVIHTIELLNSGLNTQRPLEFLINQEILYSRFAHYIKLDDLESILTNAELPLYIVADDTSSTYRLVSYSDDICRLPDAKAAAFHQKGEATHTFKSEEDMQELLAFMGRQDANPAFRALAKKIFLKRADKYINKPLHFVASWKKSPWGGGNLSEFKNIPLPSDDKMGEIWEVSAQPRNSLHLKIGSEIQPITLLDLMNDDTIAEKIVGPRVFKIAKNWFPILYKFLDVTEMTSVHIHPSSQLAEELGEGEPGKSGTLVVLKSKPDACIYVGLHNDVTLQQLEKAIRDKSDILPLLKKYKAKEGDVFYITPGIIHSVGAGMVVAEAQSNSDITYRLYDHQRTPARPVHVPQGLKCMNLKDNYEIKPRVQPTVEKNTFYGSRVELLAKDPYYEVRRAYLKFHDHITIPRDGDFLIVSMLQGKGKLEVGTSKTTLHRGQTVLVSASSEPVTLITQDQEGLFLLVKPGSYPQPAPAPEPIIYAEMIHAPGPVNLAVSIGGTKLAFGAVTTEGLLEMSPRIEWKKILETQNQYNAEGFIDLILDELEKIVATLEKKGIPKDKLNEIGIAWPGPGDYQSGIVSATFIPGFNKYPLKTYLQKKLKERLDITPQVKILFDAWADVFGEMAQDKTLKNWMYLNIATGIAVGIVKDGKIIDSYEWPGKVKVESGLGSIGRHMIRLENGSWEYRPTPNGEIASMAKGEVRMTEWLGGPALAKRLIDVVISKWETSKNVVPDDFFETSAKKLKEEVKAKDSAAIRKVLSMICKRAQEKNELALEMIADVGKEIGLALRTFAENFPQESFHNRIILGGGIGENFGKDIPAIKCNSDILIYNMIQVSEIANIQRTKMDFRRELLAFKPEGNSIDPKVLIFNLDQTFYNSDKPIHFYQDIDQWVQPTSGLREMLMKLKTHYRLVLTANTTERLSLAILKKLQIEDLFEKIYHQTRDINHGLIQKEAGVPFGEMLYIGCNEEEDLVPARLLAMQTLKVNGPEDLIVKCRLTLLKRL